jgi:regulator of RNase E activity RraA/CMP-N-acetylneuraminic acid synthetase
VINAASAVPCRVLRRDPALANNSTDGNRLFLNEVMQVEADIYIQILGTSPFVTPETIKAGIEKLAAPDSPFDSAVLVRKERQYTWHGGRPTYDIDNIPNSVDLGDTIIETMGLYIVRRETALQTKRRIGNVPFLIDASALEAVDVNWPEDFELANLIASGMRERDRRLLANIKNQLTSSLLSDLLDDFGYPGQIVRGLHPNFQGAKIFGRAKTLKLRQLQPGEDFRGIYEALQSYETVVPNDIIVVENETPDYAYFGELNANLAVRAGAAGVIVGGRTRDSAEVMRIGLPVFATGYICQDVRKRATTESINKPIQLNGVRICAEDLVFGDPEGVVVIPRQIEVEVMNELYKRASNEKKILVDISMGAEVDALVKNYGFF